MSSDLEMDSQNTISIHFSSSSDDSSSSSSSTRPSLSLLSPTSNAPTSPPALPSFDNQTTLNRPKFQPSFSSPPSSLPLMAPLPDLVVRRSSSTSTASSTSSSSFASYLPQHHDPPPLPTVPAIYSNPPRKPRHEEFRPRVQDVKQLDDKRARTKALLCAQSSSKKNQPPKRRSTAPLASRIASEGNAVEVTDIRKERSTPERREAGDRSSSFGALEDARKNLARRSGFGVPLPMTSRPPSSVFLLDASNTDNRSSFIQDYSTSPLDTSSPLHPPLPQDPNPSSSSSSLDAPHRFHPQRSQSTPSVARDSSPSPPDLGSLRTRTRTVSFAESPVHIIDDDPFLEGSSDEEEEEGDEEDKKRRKKGGKGGAEGKKKGWWSKAKKRVQSIFVPRALPSPPPTLDSTPTTLEDSKPSSASTPPPSSNSIKANAFQRLFRPPTLPYANGSKLYGSAPDLRATLSSKNASSGSLRGVKTEERRKSVFDPLRAGERGAVPGGGRAAQLTDAQLQRRLGRMEDDEERRVAESLFL